MKRTRMKNKTSSNNNNKWTTKQNIRSTFVKDISSFTCNANELAREPIVCVCVRAFFATVVTMARTKHVYAVCIYRHRDTYIPAEKQHKFVWVFADSKHRTHARRLWIYTQRNWNRRKAKHLATNALSNAFAPLNTSLYVHICLYARCKFKKFLLLLVIRILFWV